MNSCIFCGIASGQTGADILFEDEQCAAFRDMNPQAPTHILVIPKRHISSLNDLGEAPHTLMHHLFSTVRNLAESLGLSKTGYRVVINTGADGGQTVFHLHLHLLGGRSMQWPPG
jgi:histidine triad (HIT) family protein